MKHSYKIANPQSSSLSQFLGMLHNCNNLYLC